MPAARGETRCTPRKREKTRAEVFWVAVKTRMSWPDVTRWRGAGVDGPASGDAGV